MSEIQGIAPPDTLPEKAIPIPTPSTPSPHIPSVKALRAWAPLYLKRTDKLICHLNRLLSTPEGTDSFLAAVGYSSLVASTVLSSVSIHQLRHQVRRLLSAASSLPANTTILIDTSAVATPQLLRLSQSLKTFSELISDYRIFIRLWALLGVWEWGKGLIKNPPTDSVKKRIAWAQFASILIFQYLENGAYLASKGVIGWGAKKQTKAWLWSSRLWSAYVFLDIFKLLYESRTEQGKGKEKEDEKKSVVNAKWVKEMVVNLAYAPLTVHWGLENGLLNQLTVGILGSVAGIIKVKDHWTKTAE